jgi:hypothetical protein
MAGFYLVCHLVAALNPTDLDALVRTTEHPVAEEYNLSQRSATGCNTVQLVPTVQHSDGPWRAGFALASGTAVLKPPFRQRTPFFD